MDLPRLSFGRKSPQRVEALGYRAHSEEFTQVYRTSSSGLAQTPRLPTDHAHPGY